MRPYDGTGPTVSPVAPGQSVIAIAASESATESAVAALLNTGVDMPSGTKKCTLGLLDSSLTLLGLDFDCEDARFALNESYLAMWHRDDHLFALARNAPAVPIELDSVDFPPRVLFISEANVLFVAGLVGNEAAIEARLIDPS